MSAQVAAPIPCWRWSRDGDVRPQCCPPPPALCRCRVRRRRPTHAQRLAAPATTVSGRVDPTAGRTDQPPGRVVTVELVAPDDGSGMGTTGSPLAWPVRGWDRGAIENQFDGGVRHGCGWSVRRVPTALRGDTGRASDEVAGRSGPTRSARSSWGSEVSSTQSPIQNRHPMCSPVR